MQSRRRWDRIGLRQSPIKDYSEDRTCAWGPGKLANSFGRSVLRLSWGRTFCVEYVMIIALSSSSVWRVILAYLALPV